MDFSSQRTLGEATDAALVAMKELGLKHESHTAAHQILWALAVWQGKREARNARADMVEQMANYVVQKEPT